MISEQGTEYEATLVISALVNDFLQKKEVTKFFLLMYATPPFGKCRVKWALWSIFGESFLKVPQMPIYTNGTFQKGASLGALSKTT